MINDASINDDYNEELEVYFHNLSDKIIYVPLQVRRGLIRARMLGARKATGDVLVFMVNKLSNYHVKYEISDKTAPAR